MVQPRIPRAPVIAAIIVALTSVSLAGLLLPALSDEAFGRRDPVRFVPALVAVAGVCGLYGRLLWLNLTRRSTPAHRLGLAAITAVSWTLPAVLGVHTGWGNALLVPAGLIAVVLPVRQAAYVAGAGTIAGAAYGVALGMQPLAVLYQLVAFPMVTFSGYITVWLFHVVQELREARAELARSAVGEERMRFARDLHDVLGHSLQAVALRAEVAERFADRDPARVRKELAEIQTMARDAVKDVREVVRGYRATSLRTELDGMSAVLRAAGIDCDRPDLPAGLPGGVHEPLGWVVREAATNILRHSSATWCRIDVAAEPGGGRVRLEIVNDGAARRDGPPGSGLAGLAERLAAAGGEFAAGAIGDGTFRLVAALPTGGS
ncbi:sensor histidine kinase [Actinomadura rupiterrae]|uniref:sensor histidine kinase n=1 Tax=Actinomadura rupiterrae TaxID=559627 RepID=UPI0020A52C8D|nr:histidine kinase [Actinomadura rupiterrae]MCP2335662.1 two-component system sensor histidine kinase DesK [Actinomadura rupiterrae]